RLQGAEDRGVLEGIAQDQCWQGAAARGEEHAGEGLAGRRQRSEDMAKLNVNGKVRDVDVEADTPLLWVLREQVGLTGTKYGCGGTYQRIRTAVHRAAELNKSKAKA